MPKQSPKPVKNPSSKKLNPAITVALIALAGTLVTALFSSPVIIAWIQRTPVPPSSAGNPSEVSSDSGATPISTSTTSNSSATPIPPSTPSNPIAISNDKDCMSQFFAEITPQRQLTLEVGANNQEYFISSGDFANKDFHGPIGIRLTQNGEPIAAFSFLYFLENRLFKIVSFVDSKCQPVAEYSNWSEGGDHNILQDSDRLKMDLPEGSFSVRFIFDGPNDFGFDFDKIQ